MSEMEKKEAKEFAKAYANLSHGDKRFVQGLMTGMTKSQPKEEKKEGK